MTLALCGFRFFLFQHQMFCVFCVFGSAMVETFVFGLRVKVTLPEPSRPANYALLLSCVFMFTFTPTIDISCRWSPKFCFVFFCAATMSSVFTFTSANAFLNMIAFLIFLLIAYLKVLLLGAYLLFAHRQRCCLLGRRRDKRDASRSHRQPSRAQAPVASAL